MDIRRDKNSPIEEDPAKYLFQVEVFIVRGFCKSAWKHYESECWKLFNSNHYEKLIEKAENIQNVLHCGKDFEIEVYLKIFKLEMIEKVQEEYDSTFDKFEVLEHLEDLCVDEKFTDYTIIYKNIELKCHKAILAARSKFFARLIKDSPNMDLFEFADNKDINEIALAQFFQFIYVGEAEFHSIETSKMLMGLGRVFGVTDLKKIYENVLIAHTTPKNALDMLNTAIRFEKCYNLKEFAFKCIKKHYKSLNIDIPDDMINHPNLIMSYASDAMVKMVENLRV